MGIDRGAAMPVYLQLAAVLRQQITAGVHGPGTALPTEDGIGRVHHVGRMSVRRALDVLRHEGLITTERGRPAIVRPQPERTFVELGDADRLVARMPTRDHAHRLRIQAGVPLLEVYRADGSVETYPADLYGAQCTPRFEADTEPTAHHTTSRRSTRTARGPDGPLPRA